MAKRKLADVYITPESGVGGEFPTPIPFWRPMHSRRFVEAYAQACERLGQKIRIEWYDERGELVPPVQKAAPPIRTVHQPLASIHNNMGFVLSAWVQLSPQVTYHQAWQLTMQWMEMDSSRRETVVEYLQERLNANNADGQ